MANIVFGKDKDFEDNNGQSISHNARVVKTLPAVVTVCLAPCNLCTGEYIDTTLSFRLSCLCPCHGLDRWVIA